MIFLIVHAEYAKLCLTRAVNKQLNKSFANIPDIYCLFEALNKTSRFCIKKFQIYMVSWPRLKCSPCSGH